MYNYQGTKICCPLLDQMLFTTVWTEADYMKPPHNMGGLRHLEASQAKIHLGWALHLGCVGSSGQRDADGHTE